MKNLLVLGLALVLWVPWEVSAQVSGLWLSCPNCSESEYVQRVPRQANQRFVVYDLPRGNLRPFEVYCPNVVPFGTVNSDPAKSVSTEAAVCSSNDIQILSKSPLPFEASFFDSAVEGWDSTGGQMKVEVEVDYRDVVGYNLIGIDAYRILGDMNMRGMLGSALATFPPRNQLPAWTAYMLAHVDTALGFTDTITIYLTVVLYDGSTVSYKYVIHAPSATYMEGESRTQGGASDSGKPSGRRPGHMDGPRAPKGS